MLELPVYSIDGEMSGNTVSLNPDVFQSEINGPVLHQVVSVLMANQHQGTASTLTRGQVKTSGRKIWRQKGTGRARHGTRSVPLWRGGGVAFGPVPGFTKKRVPRKMRRAAFTSALSVKVADEAFYVVESLDLADGRTRTMAAVLEKMGLTGCKSLIVLEAPNDHAIQAGANLSRGEIQLLHQTSVVDLMKYDKVIMTRAAVDEIERRLSN